MYWYCVFPSENAERKNLFFAIVRSSAKAMTDWIEKTPQKFFWLFPKKAEPAHWVLLPWESKLERCTLHKPEIAEKERVRGGSPANASAGTRLPESLSPRRFQLDEVSPDTPATPWPNAKQHLSQPQQSKQFLLRHIPFLTHTISTWVCQTPADLAYTLSWLSPSLLLCPALPSRAGWAALLLLFSHPVGPWPAQWEGEEPRPAVLSQVRVSNQPLFSFQKLSLWSWAPDTHLDAWCDGGQGFQGDL